MAGVVCGIYQIRNVVSGRFYVGSSDNIYRRFEAHRRRLRAGMHTNVGLQGSWAKHGEDAFKFEVVIRVPVDALRGIERNMLVPLLSHPLCCNMHDETYVFPHTGRKHSDTTRAKISAKVRQAVAEGRGGKFIPSEETRAKMSESLKGNQNAKGHVRTEEHRKNLAEANKGNQNWVGKKHTMASRIKMGRAVIAVSPGGAETRYATITVLRQALHLTSPTVNRALKSGAPISGGRMRGWAFRYA